MAEAAWSAGEHELAFRVFAAANQLGEHRDYLIERCRKLTRRTPPDAPHLSLVT